MNGAESGVTAGLAFLGELERAESELLSWGIVEGSFTQEELVARAMGYIDRRVDAGNDPGFTSANALLGWLVNHALLWPVYGEEGRYRTRMAEALRLIAKLRQMFPRLGRGQAQPQAGWRTAKNLVADFRFLLGPRKFPKRRIEHTEALAAIGKLREPTSRYRHIVRALLRADSNNPRKLAKFQLDASTTILRRLRPMRRASGTIVCAGTGSGKTLAFYLPAFIAIADWLGNRPWTKCLAVYPRNELLKDQLREALGQAKRVKGAMKGGCTIAIGVLYGDVPRDAKQLLGDVVQKGNHLEAWEPVGKDALRCPLADCPECNGRLLWKRSDIQKEVERLECEGCRLTWGPTELRLTRKAMLASPPDLLFTSTEMLNQRMATELGPLFGVGVPETYRPRLVLLDEVHTYEGVHGAQVALLLRRWQRLAGVRPHFVGLSATLIDAARFFADIVGALPGDVTEIGSEEEELDAEGMEYLLALRGDPVSGVSLLSTSIQTIMLLRRILEPATARSPAFGRKVFSFTDNLDVNNRLYFDLLDAEGWSRPNVPHPRKPWGSLATLRRPDLPEHASRLAHGQSWDLVEWVGHTLGSGTRVPVGRVSSLDRGIDRSAEMVVATSSLEVGFDDPDVGAVVQHKAPRSGAAFLQRKGRAGRRREMRPWTVVVLSDFGRDRVAYQAYEQLFSPVLFPRHLPIGNRHVLKIQAAYVLVEWIAIKLALQGHGHFDLWSELSGPPDERSSYAELTCRRQQAAARLLLGVLRGGALRASLVDYLQSALRLDEGTLGAVLWEAPRALLTAVVPTWLRRLERSWERSMPKRPPGPVREPHVPRSPLPEFAPRALFSDLNLPEVEVVLRNAYRERAEWMPIAQTLREFAPGRVSHRYSIQHVAQRNWVSVTKGSPVVLLENFCDAEHVKELGNFLVRGADGNDECIAAVRPFRIVAPEPPSEVDSSSNAFPRWSTTLIPKSDGLRLDLPRGSRWGELVEGVRVYLHALGSPVELSRVTPGADTILRLDGVGTEAFVRFARRKAAGEGVEPVALGFTADVDAIAFDLRLPTSLAAISAADPRLLRAIRPAYFRDRVQADARLAGIANRFQRDWLADTYLSALVVRAVESGTSLEEAAQQLRAPKSGDTLRAVLDTLFMALSSTEDESPTDEVERGKRHEEVLELLNHPSVTKVFDESATVLWGTPDATWESWLRTRLEVTLGIALIEAIQALCTQTAAGDLILEFGLRGPSPSSLWLTEASLGGAGVVEEFVARYGQDPRRFFNLLDGVLEPSHLEEIDTQIRTLLSWIEPGSSRGNAKVVAAVQAMRDARDHQELVESSASFRRLLAERGAVVSQSVMAALFARVLRPGSSPESDALLAGLVARWNALEERLGIEIEPRCIALLESRSDALDQALRLNEVVAPPERRGWRFATLLGLLWLRGLGARAESLKASSPFAALPSTEKLLLSALLPAASVDVPIENNDWLETFARLLVERGSAGISCSITEPTRLRAAMLRVLVEPVDADVLLVHVRHQGIRRDAERIVAVFDLPEAVQ